MKLSFSKYQGCGNDFVIINNLNKTVDLSEEQIAFLCNRRFGIGADGLMLIEPSEDADFKMKYFNSDGKESTLCGNGSRCIVKYAFENGFVNENCHFESIVGIHSGKIIGSQVEISMMDVSEIKNLGLDSYELNTGSPHYVTFQSDIRKFPLLDYARQIRYSQAYPNGINVNIVEVIDMKSATLFVRTYERGVEDETYSCGTGITAASLCFLKLHPHFSDVRVQSIGGSFIVGARQNKESFISITLLGDAKKVFDGNVVI